MLCFDLALGPLAGSAAGRRTAGLHLLHDNDEWCWRWRDTAACRWQRLRSARYGDCLESRGQGKAQHIRHRAAVDHWKVDNYHLLVLSKWFNQISYHCHKPLFHLTRTNFQSTSGLCCTLIAFQCDVIVLRTFFLSKLEICNIVDYLIPLRYACFLNFVLIFLVIYYFALLYFHHVNGAMCANKDNNGSCSTLSSPSLKGTVIFVEDGDCSVRHWRWNPWFEFL